MSLKIQLIHGEPPQSRSSDIFFDKSRPSFANSETVFEVALQPSTSPYHDLLLYLKAETHPRNTTHRFEV